MKKSLWFIVFMSVFALSACDMPNNQQATNNKENPKVAVAGLNTQQKQNNNQQNNNQQEQNNNQQNNNQQEQNPELKKQQTNTNNNEDIQYLPTFLFNQKKDYMNYMNQYIKVAKGVEPKQEKKAIKGLGEKQITVYIDKNCESAQIPQCQANVWKQQLGQLLGNNFKIEYITKDNAQALKNIVYTSPVFAIPASEIGKLGAQGASIKQQAKFVDGVYYLPLYGWIIGEENLCNDGKDNNGDGKIDAQDPTCYKMTVLTSSKCTEQYCNDQVLKNMFMGYTVNIVDYNTPEGKKLYDELKTNKDNLAGYRYQLNIPQFKYDPSIEACKTDCNASPACKKLLTCNKSDKPNVDLYVMSYCPFGTQAEKGILGAVNALKGKINFKVKFVNYAMHGKKEIDENNLQYCIQKEEPTKYNAYLTCFLDKGNTQDCIQKANLDMNKINACIEKVKTEFKTEEDFNNKASWLNGQFPRYRVNDKENLEYGVQGSPTLVINGVKVQPKSRSPQAYLEAICSAFTNPPKECQQALSNQAYDPSFGWTQNGQAVPAGSCGGN